MNFLVISSIANFQRYPVQAEKFESRVDEYKWRLSTLASDFQPSGGLETVFVQYQFDAAGALNATRGFKLGRYSPRRRSIDATVEVTDGFGDLDERSGDVILASLLIEVLRKIESKLEGQVSNNLNEFVSLIERDARLLRAH